MAEVYHSKFVRHAGRDDRSCTGGRRSTHCFHIKDRLAIAQRHRYRACGLFLLPFRRISEEEDDPGAGENHLHPVRHQRVKDVQGSAVHADHSVTIGRRNLHTGCRGAEETEVVEGPSQWDSERTKANQNPPRRMRDYRQGPRCQPVRKDERQRARVLLLSRSVSFSLRGVSFSLRGTYPDSALLFPS